MKKLILGLIFVLVSLISFTSCEIENNTNLSPNWPYAGYYCPYTTNANGQYVIGGYIDGQTRALTRAATTSTYGDVFSVFGLANGTSEDSLVMNNFNGVFSGNTWGYSESLKYFDNFVPSYSFLSIIPKGTYSYDATNDAVEISAQQFSVNDKVVDETYYDDQEILLANTQVAQNKYAEGASLQFKHINSKIGLYFTSNDPNTQILDYSPSSPAVPATPATETYTSKSTKFIDELVAGNEVQVGIGFYGVSSSKLTSTQPNPLYVGSNNGTWLAKDWLLSIKDAVNSQFVYYRLNAVANSTSKTETTEDWESAASNKNIFMMKLADGVNATDFANGNDAFMNALTAHESDWVGGSPATTFKSTFQKAYDEGWRVIRINVSDANANQVMVFLSNNQNITTQVCTVTPGIPGSSAVQGIDNIILLPAISTLGDGTDAVLSTYPDNVTITANVKTDTYTINTVDTKNSLTFVKPTGNISTTRVASPMTWFTFPYNDVANVGYTLKVSYVYKGTNVYDARVWIPVSECQWQAGKYYKYIIQINGKGNGHETPNDLDGNDPKVAKNNEIKLAVSILDYESGEEYTHVIQ